MHQEEVEFVVAMVKEGLSPARAFVKVWGSKGLSPTKISNAAAAKCRRKDIKDYRNQLMERAKKLTEIDSDWLLVQYKRLYDFDINRFLSAPDSDGIRWYDFRNATESDWFCIQEYIVTKKHTGLKDGLISENDVKVKGYDKKAILDSMGRHIHVAAFQQEQQRTDSQELVDALKAIAGQLPD